MPDKPLPTSSPARRFDLKRLLTFLLHPRLDFDRLAAEEQSLWQLPMLVLSLTLILSTVASGFLKARAAALGEVPLPPDWQYWTPEMQNTFMQAMQQTQGPVFVYVIPLVLGLSALWLGWPILSGLLHLSFTLFGGRGKMGTALNLVAWASLPLALRDLLRMVYMLAAQHAITSAGLSGFITASSNATIFLAQLLANIDLFFVWHLLLLVLGFSRADNLPLGKALLGVVIVLALTLLAQAGLGTLSASLGAMIVTRQF